MAFKCTLVTPESQLFDETVTGAIVPAHDGMIGIQTGHAALLVRIGAGPCTLHRPSQADAVFFISGGVAQMKDDVLTILTDEASAPDKIDVDAARRELESLSGTPGEIASADAMERRRRRVHRAQAVLRMAGVA